MPRRHRPSGTHTLVPIKSGPEYEKALKKLGQLQRAVLGSPQTEGLQELVEAILDFETQHERGDGHVVPGRD